MIPTDYAGKYLKYSEAKRYSFSEKYTPSITLPSPSETLCDFSFYQAGLDWARYRQNFRAAVLKVSQGSWKDPEFDEHYASARENGVALGGYIFFDGRYSPSEQAKTFISAMQGKTLDMEVYIDWERVYNGAFEGLRYVVTLMKMIEQAGYKVGIYTGYYFFIEHALEKDLFPYLTERPLWIAWYASAAVVKIPPPWTSWKLWQSGTPVLNYATKENDFNHYNGSPSQFEAEYLGATMYVEGLVNATAGLNIRSGPSATSSILGKLPYQTTVYGFLESGWIKGTFNGISGYINAQYVTYHEVPQKDETKVQLSIDDSGAVTAVDVDGVAWQPSP
jgi:GH25 family lysozyme M1 (1,4-beta-N-acetylmuramidase)